MIQNIDEWLKDNATNEIIYNRNLTPNQKEFPTVFLDDEDEELEREEE